MSKIILTQQEIAPKASNPVFNSLGNGLSHDSPVETKTLKQKQIKILFSSTYDLVLTAVFVAIGVVLNIQSSTFPRVDFFGRMSLIYGYCLIVGIVLGALRGGIASALSDMLVALVLPESGQIFMPLITISNFFMAFIPGLIYQRSNKLTLSLVIGSLISFVVCTLGFSALGETLLYSYFGSKPFYPSITVLVETGIPVYIAFVIRKATLQPFWIILNLIAARLILETKSLKKVIEKIIK